MKKLNWGHGVIIALGSFIVFILSLIFIYSHGQKNSELITDDYYEEELVYQDVIDAKNNADQLLVKPTYSQNERGIFVTFPKEINNHNSVFSIDLHRSEDQNLDLKKTMKLDVKNALYVPKEVLVKGNYVLRVHWIKDKKNYQLDYDLVW